MANRREEHKNPTHDFDPGNQYETMSNTAKTVQS